MNNKTLGKCVYCDKSLFSESIHTCAPQAKQKFLIPSNSTELEKKERSEPVAKLQVTLEDRPIDIELAQYKRMFEAACSALGEVGAALGCDHDEGGAEPLLAAIAELKNLKQEHGEPTRHELQAKGEHPAPCARFCEATAFWITERGLKRRIDELTAQLNAQPKQEPVACLECGSNNIGVPANYDSLISSVKTKQSHGVECCTWKRHDDTNMPDTWEADCGAMWTFAEGGPKANDMKFCPNCGEPIIESSAIPGVKHD